MPLTRKESHDLYMEEQKANLLQTLGNLAAVGLGKTVKATAYDIPKLAAVSTYEVAKKHGPFIMRAAAQVAGTLGVEGCNRVSDAYGQVTGWLGEVEGITYNPGENEEV